jgi:hypothetical protein
LDTCLVYFVCRGLVLCEEKLLCCWSSGLKSDGGYVGGGY